MLVMHHVSGMRRLEHAWHLTLLNVLLLRGFDESFVHGSHLSVDDRFHDFAVDHRLDLCGDYLPDCFYDDGGLLHCLGFNGLVLNARLRDLSRRDWLLLSFCLVVGRREFSVLYDFRADRLLPIRLSDPVDFRDDHFTMDHMLEFLSLLG